MILGAQSIGISISNSAALEKFSIAEAIKFIANALLSRKLGLDLTCTKSPDVKPIENLWDENKRGFRQLDSASSNLKTLESAIHWIGSKIPRTTFQHLMIPCQEESIHVAVVGMDSCSFMEKENIADHIIKRRLDGSATLTFSRSSQ
ncbi:hypothetical protein TNCV_41991 [Trichonephila clavipes]|nr:hypothetical protein TNCV_41991 [Trichonephila clavipes]